MKSNLQDGNEMLQEGGMPTLSILSMEVDDEDEVDSEYRLLAGRIVRYLRVAPATFDRDTLSLPLHVLPPLPYHDETWNVARISRNPDTGELQTLLRHEGFVSVQSLWHPVRIDVLDLERTEQLSATAFRARLLSESTAEMQRLTDATARSTVVAKIARFEWEIPRIERETQAYQRLEEQGASDLAPRFMGHLIEGDRVMGILLEDVTSVKGISVDDLSACEKCLARLHRLGLLHGDVNRYNFINGPEGVKLIDFENFQENVVSKLLAREMESLRVELLDESGKGGRFV